MGVGRKGKGKGDNEERMMRERIDAFFAQMEENIED